MRDIPDEQERVPGLPHRAAARLADRNRHHRRRLPTPRERPDGPHRRPLGTRRRRSHPQTTSPPLQRRLRHLLDMAPRSRTTARPPIPLPQRRRSKSRMRSLQKSRTLMNWPAVERVWLPGWLDDRAGVIDHLVTVARRAAQSVVELRAQPNAVPEESPEEQAAQDIATRVDSAEESELVDMQPGRSELS